MYIILISSGVLIVLTSSILLLFILLCDQLGNSHIFPPLFFLLLQLLELEPSKDSHTGFVAQRDRRDSD